MKFWERITSMEEAVRQLGASAGRQFWELNVAGAYQAGDSIILSQVRCENIWAETKKPYYNVWPTIVPLLLKINLDFSPSAWRMPSGMKYLCVRLPERGCPEIPGVRSILFGDEHPPGKPRQMSMWVDIGEFTHPVPHMPSYRVAVMTFLICPLDGYATLQAAFDDQGMHSGGKGEEADAGMLLKCLKLVTTLAILEDDPALIRPDALSKDENDLIAAFEKNDQAKVKMISERAFRRRGPGWHVGQLYEPGAAYVVPPHPQRYHVGKGRDRVIIKVRRGYEVKGEELRRVPTGFQ